MWQNNDDGQRAEACLFELKEKVLTDDEYG
jgi:hypothetical protein